MRNNKILTKIILKFNLNLRNKWPFSQIIFGVRVASSPLSVAGFKKKTQNDAILISKVVIDGAANLILRPMLA